MNHSERCYAESTRDVIFLLQGRRRIFFREPTGYTRDSDSDYCWRKTDDDGKIIESEEIVSDDDAAEADPECFVTVWDTESVWLDRDEAEAHGEAHSYHYDNPRKNVGWRVYGMPSYGDLAKLLQSQDKASTP